MFPGQLERLADERRKDLDRSVNRTRTGRPEREHPHVRRRSVRHQAGWALIIVGLRIAASGSR